MNAQNYFVALLNLEGGFEVHAPDAHSAVLMQKKLQKKGIEVMIEDDLATPDGYFLYRTTPRKPVSVLGIRESMIVRSMNPDGITTKEEIDERTKEISLREVGEAPLSWGRGDRPTYYGGYDPCFWKRDNAEILSNLVRKGVLYKVAPGQYKLPK